jgi:hypothetical protein
LCTVSVASTWIRIGSFASMPAARPTQQDVAKHSVVKQRTEDFNGVSTELLKEDSLQSNYKYPDGEVTGTVRK